MLFLNPLEYIEMLGLAVKVTHFNLRIETYRNFK